MDLTSFFDAHDYGESDFNWRANPQLERAILGSLFVHPDAYEKIAGIVISSEMFWEERHRRLFEEIGRFLEQKLEMDHVSFADFIDRTGRWDARSVINYIRYCERDGALSVSRTVQMAHQLADRYELRARIFLETERIERLKVGESLVEVNRDIDARLSVIKKPKRASGPRRIKEYLKGLLSDYEKVSKSGDERVGLATGFEDLDNITGGFQAPDLIILAGRPSMGKTAVALNMCHYMADCGVPVAMFSLEMSSVQVTARIICHRARIDSNVLRDARLDEAEWARLIRSAGDLVEMPFWIDDQPALTITQFQSRARYLVHECGVRFICVDYLQLMKAPGKSINSREQEISAISSSLKATAKELDVPILALAQLNRGVEQRADKRPMNSDLRESGAIEQDADIISFIYRDEVYNSDTDDKGIAEIILGKHRNGALGTVRLKFLGKFMTFMNLEPEDDRRVMEYAEKQREINSRAS
jgi:replicative DNA helicase